MTALCFSPIILFLILRFAYPQLAYLSFLAFLICPISMVFMMSFMGKRKNCGDHNEKKNKPGKI